MSARILPSRQPTAHAGSDQTRVRAAGGLQALDRLLDARAQMYSVKPAEGRSWGLVGSEDGHQHPDLALGREADHVHLGLRQLIPG